MTDEKYAAADVTIAAPAGDSDYVAPTIATTTSSSSLPSATAGLNIELPVLSSRQSSLTQHSNINNPKSEPQYLMNSVASSTSTDEQPAVTLPPPTVPSTPDPP
eukprot:CAMPEP_0113438470 /NCGR_PEP_ID=MMETSP0013_2-20120614/37965_1 /TAXON_ID=2843 ORGANISM="Skeletonema costatum, Strain 1716" /NCGR_SAMPLE_ID=MMETSP0013_2 /ASSEMBLY_ACC=CAM_ASM_000158 /LENGTH=103 /DNA_ID=CAMNT_0000329191 /DNA_START=38 /DNA_END=346 /DNA_ORIENTATION=- /assembly_acc=CAM_ASM_000158